MGNILHEGVSVQPGDGFGRLLPGQAVPLVLLYSPGAKHIAGNAAGHNGLDGERAFKLRCETVASWGARPQTRAPAQVRAGKSHEAPSGETRKSAVEDGSESRDAESGPQPEISQLTASKSIDDIKECLDKVMRPEPPLGSAAAGENVVRCRAHVVDPVCQLSCSFLLLPATPCGTLRTAHVRIVPNTASRTPCVCGELAARAHARRHVWFRFHRPASGELVLQPSAGHLLLGEEVKVLVAFRPQIPEKDVEETARRLKARKLMEEAKKSALQQQVARKVGPTMRRRMVTPKEDSVKEATSTGPEAVDPETVELTVSDKFKAEKWLLENFKAYDFHCKVTCVMETATSDSPQAPRRKEVLHLDVLCPVVRPDVILRGDSQHVSFGPTAVGTRPRTVVLVENISSSISHLSTSLLNPVGMFSSSLRNGTGLEPGKIIGIVVTFAPEDESKQQELYEIRGGQAALSVLISGEGVRPQFQLIPDFEVYRLESQPGRASTCIVEVENSCTAPLPFQVHRLFVGWAVDIPTQESKPFKVKKPKRHDKMSPELTADEQKDIDENFKSVDEDLAETIFSLSGLSAIGSELVVSPFGKGQFKVTFTPPENVFAILGETKVNNKEDPPNGVENNGKGDAKKKRRGNREEVASKKSRTKEKDQSIKYVAKYKITLGRIVDIRELVFFGWTRRK